MDGLRHLHRIAMPADMHVESQRLCAQQVVMDSCDINTAFDQLSHDWIYFALKQDEVAHHHRHVPHRLERGPAAESECRADRYAVERHLQVGSRKAVAMNGTADRARPAENAIDLGPIDSLRMGADCRCHNNAASSEEFNNAHDIGPPDFRHDCLVDSFSRAGWSQRSRKTGVRYLISTGISTGRR